LLNSINSLAVTVARPCHDHGVNQLAPSFVRNADHRALRHGRMLGDGVFDFDRIDVLAAGNDHVLDPIDDIDESVVVHVAAVAYASQPSMTARAVSSGRSQ